MGFRTKRDVHHARGGVLRGVQGSREGFQSWVDSPLARASGPRVCRRKGDAMPQQSHGSTLIVMAAGMGSRYGGLKQIEPVGPEGEWIIDYSVFDAIRAGFDRVLFVVREEVEVALRERFDLALEGRCDVAYVHQRKDDLPEGFEVPADRVKPWGTGQAILACRHELDGPFAVINADDFYGRSGFRLLAEFLEKPGEDHALIGYPLMRTMTEHGTVSRGICQIGDDGTLGAIAERKRVAFRDGATAFTEDGETWEPIAADAVASMNMWGFRRSFVADLERHFVSFLSGKPGPTGEYCIPVIVGELLARGEARVQVLPTGDAWFGVTYKEDLQRTREGIGALVRQGQYPAPLWG